MIAIHYCMLLFSCSVESSAIDLSEFQEENRDDSTGSGGDGNDNNRDADGQVGNTEAQQAAGTNGEVSLTHFTLKYILIKNHNYELV